MTSTVAMVLLSNPFKNYTAACFAVQDISKTPAVWLRQLLLCKHKEPLTLWRAAACHGHEACWAAAYHTSQQARDTTADSAAQHNTA